MYVPFWISLTFLWNLKSAAITPVVAVIPQTQPDALSPWVLNLCVITAVAPLFQRTPLGQFCLTCHSCTTRPWNEKPIGLDCATHDHGMSQKFAPSFLCHQHKACVSWYIWHIISLIHHFLQQLYQEKTEFQCHLYNFIESWWYLKKRSFPNCAWPH